jgi:hypothetical protein
MVSDELNPNTAQPRPTAKAASGRTARGQGAATIPHTAPSFAEKATTHPALIPQEVPGSSRKAPRIPATLGQNALVSPGSPPIPAQLGSAMTGLSRRRSRVRVPSLPFPFAGTAVPGAKAPDVPVTRTRVNESRD